MEPRFPINLEGASRHTFVTSLGSFDTVLKIFRNDFLIDAGSLLSGLRIKPSARAAIRACLITPWVETGAAYSFHPRGNLPGNTKNYIKVEQIDEVLSFAQRNDYIKPRHVEIYRGLFKLPDCLQHWAYALCLSEEELDTIMQRRKKTDRSTWRYFERKIVREYLESDRDRVTLAGYSFKTIKRLASFEQPAFWHRSWHRGPGPKQPTYEGLGPWEANHG